MKKILISLLIFFSIFFTVGKVRALPLGTNFTDFSSKKVELGTFYTTQSSTPLYGNSGSGSECGTVENPNSLAPINCWTTSVLSLLKDNVSLGGNNTSIRFKSSIPIEKGMSYKVVINYELSSTSYSKIQNHWRIDYSNYDVESFNSSCNGKSCTIEYKFNSLEDSNYVWVQGNADSNQTYTFSEFNSAVAYMYSPTVEKIEKEKPSKNLLYSALQYRDEITYYYQIGTPVYNGTYYGQATLNYIKNTFIAKKEYEKYGKYYACFFSASAYSSYCYISDNPNFLKVEYGYNGYENNPTSNGFDIRLNTDVEDVYAYRVSSGSKSNDMSGYYKDLKDPALALVNGDAIRLLGAPNVSDQVYFPTNAPYIKFKDDKVSSVTTSDNYTFNNDDVVFYLTDSLGYESIEMNTEHKSADEILKGNIFDEEVDDYNYSKMVFNLNQDEIKSNNYTFDTDYKIETVGEIDDQGNLLSKDNSIEFLEPYIEYTLENRTKYLYLSNSDSSHNNPSNLWELASCPALPSGATGVKLIIPMESTKNVRYKVYFQTVVGFEVSYEYDDDVVDYYETIDLSNKYGVMFMPKIVANNYSSIYAIFEFGGIESISVYETYDYNQNPIKVYEDLDTYISFNIDSELTNYNVFFKSEQKPLRSLVRYDTRYFTYHIVDSKYSVGIVENPNTGESTFVDFGNTGTTKVTFTDISSVFTYISEQLSDNNEAYILFSNSVRTFFATMPSDVFILIITVTAVLFLGIALALGGWK